MSGLYHYHQPSSVVGHGVKRRGFYCSTASRPCQVCGKSAQQHYPVWGPAGEAYDPDLWPCGYVRTPLLCYTCIHSYTNEELWAMQIDG